MLSEGVWIAGETGEGLVEPFMADAGSRDDEPFAV